MRKMFVLRGAPGSGKSTFLAANGWDEYAVGRDRVRQLLSGPFPTLDSVSSLLPDYLQHQAVELTEQMAVHRMKNGETVFIDNTSCAPAEVKDWVKLAKPFRYEVIVVDMQGDLTNDELLARNKSRAPRNIVAPDSVVINYAETARSTTIPNVRTIKPGQVSAELDVPQHDFNKFDRVVVVGDVQGCGSALEALLDKIQLTDNDALVFIGDLFDRGVENVQAFRTISKLPNTFIVEGNHDSYLLSETYGAHSYKRATMQTLNEFSQAGITDDDVKALYRDVTDVLYAQYGNRNLVFTHGGVLTAAEHSQGVGLYPSRLFIEGQASTPMTYLARPDFNSDIDEKFQEQVDQGVIPSNVWQFHGHRNGYHHSADKFSNIFNLESGVEWDGGVLTAAVLTQSDGVANVAIVTANNPVTAGPEPAWAGCNPGEGSGSDVLKKPAARKLTLQERLRAIPTTIIEEKWIPEDEVYAYNFTRDAFQSARWTKTTVTARGLFINSTGKVVQRGYDKFFNLGERPETEFHKILEKFGDGKPVVVEHKLNGFLGIVSTQGTGTLHCYTKAGPSQYAQLFEKQLREFLGDRVTEFTEWLQAKKVSLTFEVLDPDRDPHIVSDGRGVALLHALANTERMILLEPVAQAAEDLFGFRRPDRTVVSGREEVEAALKAAQLSDTEGSVFRHVPSGAMVKVKSDSYSTWKKLRGTLQRLTAADGTLVVPADVNFAADRSGLLATVVLTLGWDLTEFVTEGVQGNFSPNILKLREAFDAARK